MMAGKVVSIEGCIGVGKSTVKRALQSLVEADSILSAAVVFVDEPVDEWATYVGDDGRGMLEMFYADQERWALAFQTMAYSTRLGALRAARAASPSAVLVCERSLAADKHTFAQMLSDEGTMKAVEHKVYEAFVEASDAAAFEPDRVFHLTVQNEIAMSRIAARSRTGETAIMDDYNERLAAYTAKWVSSLAPGTTLELDVTADGHDAVRTTAQKMFNELEGLVGGRGALNRGSNDIADALIGGC